MSSDGLQQLLALPALVELNARAYTEDISMDVTFNQMMARHQQRMQRHDALETAVGESRTSAHAADLCPDTAGVDR